MNIVDLRSGKIETLPAMLTERSAHASAFFNSSLYVVGGQAETTKKKTIHDSVEKCVLKFFSVLLFVQ